MLQSPHTLRAINLRLHLCDCVWLRTCVKTSHAIRVNANGRGAAGVFTDRRVKSLKGQKSVSVTMIKFGEKDGER